MRTIILGTDWGSDCDDAVAVRMAARAALEKKINLAAICINQCLENSVASLDGFLTKEGIEVPIGLDRDITEGKCRYQKKLAQYASVYRSNEDAEDAVRLYRKVLAEASEKIDIVEIGFLQVIAKLLVSKPDSISDMTGADLVRKKVSCVWAMAGKWDEDGGQEYNICFHDVSKKAAHILCEICPVPIVFLGWEVGKDVITGSDLKKDDVLYRVMCDHGSFHGRSSWDPMLVSIALTGNPQELGYGMVQGKACINEKSGRNHFTVTEEGLHYYIVRLHDPQYYAEYINEKIR